MRVKTDVEYLRQIPLFAEVDPAHLQVLAFSTSHRKIKKDNYVFREGKEATSGFVVLEGKIEITRGTDDDLVLLAEATSGALIGETSMLAGMPFGVSARAVTDAIVLRIPRKLLFDVAEEFPDFAFKLSRAVSSRLDSSLKDLGGVQDALRAAKSWSTG